MTQEASRPGLTLAEIATSLRCDVAVVKAWSKLPDWPAPTGRRSRGRYNEYDPGGVVGFLAARLSAVEARTSDPKSGRLLTLREAADRAGIAYSTARAYAARPGQWPEPDEQRDGVKLWFESTIDARRSGRTAGRRGAARTRP